jgi:hypothetical protein
MGASMTSVRYVACPVRMPGETGQQFVDRLLAELSAKPKVAPSGPLPPIPLARTKDLPNAKTTRARPARPIPRPANPKPLLPNIPTPERGPGEPADTKEWPPKRGQRYVGVWPPRALYDRRKRADQLSGYTWNGKLTAKDWECVIEAVSDLA